MKAKKGIRCASSPQFLVIAPDGRLDNMHVQTDPEPLRVVKPADQSQSVHYKQQVNVRFLEPPPAPEPAPIIIKVNGEERERKVFSAPQKSV